MPSNMGFRQWEHLFITGKTKGVYFAFFSFLLFIFLILYNREDLFFFVVVEVGSFASFGVLVDMVSHLFRDDYLTNITFDQWIERFKGGRTHDAYGIIIQLITSAMDFVKFHLALILWIMLLPELYYIIKARFYH
ncbi:hypothetical protein OXIME_000800 [Oxyplasma meridianum]|uniref:Uncharacterized protein n=1 Tax=Oxyplasma meridianum TaxID=3073602 RepID=A0AAX4NFF0_9ARCH